MYKGIAIIFNNCNRYRTREKKIMTLIVFFFVIFIKLLEPIGLMKETNDEKTLNQ